MKKLIESIEAVNKRYLQGLNDDDQVSKMIETDKKTKGYSYIVDGEEFKLCTDDEKLKTIVEKFGYWSKHIKEFNETLKIKGGYNYMTELNASYIGTGNGKK